MHFSTGDSHWYIVEYDGHDVFFGFAIYDGDYFNAQWEYVSFAELNRLNPNGCKPQWDLKWKTRKACEVDDIRRCHADW